MPGKRALVITKDGAARIWSLSRSQELPIAIGVQDRSQIGSFSPSGDWACTGTRGGTIRLWNSYSGHLLAVMQGHQGSLSSMKFSPDGSRIVTASVDGTARIWNTDSEQLSASLDGHAYAVNSVQIDAHDRYVLTASNDQTVRLWDLAKGELIRIIGEHHGKVVTARLSADSRRVLTVSESVEKQGWDAAIWNVPSGALEVRLESVPVELGEIELSSDGRTVVATLKPPPLTAQDSRCAESTTLAYRWDAQTGKSLTALRGHTCAVLSVKFSRDGRWILTTSADHSVRVWNASNGEVLQSLLGHSDAVNYAEFSEDGSFVITASADQTARVFDRATGRVVGMLRASRGPLRMAVLDTSNKSTPRAVTVSEEGEAQLWDIHSERAVTTMDHGVEGAFWAVFSEDGTLIGTRSKKGVVQLWEGNTGKLLARVSPVELAVTAVAFSRDALRVVTGMYSGGLLSWDLGSGQRYPLSGAGRHAAQHELSLLFKCRVPLRISGSTLRSEELVMGPECPRVTQAKQVGRWDYARNALYSGHVALQENRFETARRHYQLAGRLFAEARYFHVQAVCLLAEALVLLRSTGQPILPGQESYPANVQQLLVAADDAIRREPMFGRSPSSVASTWLLFANELRQEVNLPTVNELSELALSRCRAVLAREQLPESDCRVSSSSER